MVLVIVEKKQAEVPQSLHVIPHQGLISIGLDSLFERVLVSVGLVPLMQSMEFNSELVNYICIKMF